MAETKIGALSDVVLKVHRGNIGEHCIVSGREQRAIKGNKFLCFTQLVKWE